MCNISVNCTCIISPLFLVEIKMSSKQLFTCDLAKELRTEVENIAARLHYMEEAKEDVRADIAVMRRAAEKADSEVTKAEMDKKKQVKIAETNL